MHLAKLVTVLICSARVASAGTFVVTNSSDSGPGSLRQAIIDANADSTPSEIDFNIPGDNVHTIAPASPLPKITHAVLFDGYTQPGATPNNLPIGDNAQLRIELNGAALSSSDALIAINASGCTLRGLVLNGAQGAAVRVDFVTNARVSGCFIGTDAAGLRAVPNNTGIALNYGSGTLIGGTTVPDRNLIAGNRLGVFVLSVSSSGTIIAGNYIGTDATGLRAIGSGDTVQLTANNVTVGGTDAGSRNVIIGYVFISASGGGIGGAYSGGKSNAIKGNYIGVLADGSAVAGLPGFLRIDAAATSNVIGGAEPGARNVISTGITITSGVNNTIQGNYIGTDATGLVASKNASGITVGSQQPLGHDPGASGNLVIGNVIAGSAADGIRINGASGTYVQSNLVGVGADGVTPLGSALNGINVAGIDTVVGGSDPGQGNLIAFNGTAKSPKNGNGIRVSSGNAMILGNSTFANAGLGIDLVSSSDPDSGVTLNDIPDQDGQQNYPLLTSARFGSGTVEVEGTLSSKANATYRVEVFANHAADLSGFGEGESYLGFVNVTTDGSGMATFKASFANASNAHVLSATATNSSRATSEFSPAFFTKAQNISTRAHVETGDNVSIAGFIIAGAEPKRIIVRGIGPSLQKDGSAFPGRLADPVLQLFDQKNALIATNDNWGDTQQGEIERTGLAPADPHESAIVQTLAPGAYTVVLSGKDQSSGVAVVEAYDLAPLGGSQMANISTRSSVGVGDNVMIGGFIVGPAQAGTARILVRGIGPSLAAASVPDPLQNPTLELRDASGALLAANDDWRTDEAQIQSTGAPPSDDRESAIVADLVSGAYTAILRGFDSATGNAVVEVYRLP